MMYFIRMEVRVLLFASYADAFGAPNIAVALRDGATVKELLAKVMEMAAGHALPPSPLIALNQEYAAPGDIVRAGDEVALIPPVAGG
jgi:molybdopterin synthase sulfur carrier subunit